MGTDNLEELLRIPKKFFQLNCCTLYCCCCLVAVTVGGSHRGCSVEKGVLGDCTEFLAERQSLFN